MIKVTDDKGHKWELAPCYPYLRSSRGLVEVQAFCYRTQPVELRNYPSIPLPVFTEWWEEGGPAFTEYWG